MSKSLSKYSLSFAESHEEHGSARVAQLVDPLRHGASRDALRLEGAQFAAGLVTHPVLVGLDVPVGHGRLMLPPPVGHGILRLFVCSVG